MQEKIHMRMVDLDGEFKDVVSTPPRGRHRRNQSMVEAETQEIETVRLKVEDQEEQSADSDVVRLASRDLEYKREQFEGELEAV